MTVNISASTSRGMARPGRLTVSGLTAAVAAAANLALYLVAKHSLDVSFVMPYRGPDSTPEPLPVAMVIVASVVPAFVAAALLGVLARLVARPWRVFLIVAAVVTLLSLGVPLSLEGVTTGTRVVLILMHLVAAAVIVGVLGVRAGYRGR